MLQPHEIISNDICDNFAKYVKDNESNPSSQEYILHTLGSFKILIQMREYEKAAWELQKVVDLLDSAYQTDEVVKLPSCVQVDNLTINKCQNALNDIFEIYIKVSRSPHKQYQSENRTISTNLSY